MNNVDLIEAGVHPTWCRNACSARRLGPTFRRTRDIDEAITLAKDGRVDIVVLEADAQIDTLCKVIEKFGGAQRSRAFDLIRDIRVDPAKRLSIAESCAAHPDHLDGAFEEHPPVRFILQCVAADAGGGGVSIFKSVDAILRMAPSEFTHAFETAHVQFVRRDDLGAVDAAVGPMRYMHPSGETGFRWRDDEQVAPRVVDAFGTLIDDAIAWFRQQLGGTFGLSRSAVPGDMLIIDNLRTTHARTALSPDSRRWMRRAWIA